MKSILMRHSYLNLCDGWQNGIWLKMWISWYGRITIHTTMCHGTSTIYHGTSTIYHGTSTIYHGTLTIYHGTSTIYHGTSSIEETCLHDLKEMYPYDSESWTHSCRICHHNFPFLKYNALLKLVSDLISWKVTHTQSWRTCVAHDNLHIVTRPWPYNC